MAVVNNVRRPTQYTYACTDLVALGICANVQHGQGHEEFLRLRLHHNPLLLRPRRAIQEKTVDVYSLRWGRSNLRGRATNKASFYETHQVPGLSVRLDCEPRTTRRRLAS